MLKFVSILKFVKKPSAFNLHLVCCVGSRSCRCKSKYKKVGVLPIWTVKFNVSSIGPSSERIILRQRSKTITIHIGSTPTFLYFDLYLHSWTLATEFKVQ